MLVAMETLHVRERYFQAWTSNTTCSGFHDVAESGSKSRTGVSQTSTRTNPGPVSQLDRDFYCLGMICGTSGGARPVQGDQAGIALVQPASLGSPPFEDEKHDTPARHVLVTPTEQVLEQARQPWEVRILPILGRHLHEFPEQGVDVQRGG